MSDRFFLMNSGYRKLADFDFIRQVQNNRRDALKNRFLFSCRIVQVCAQLKVHPEIGGISEIFCQTQCSRTCDAALAVDDFVDSLIRHLNGIGQLALCNVHRNEELFEQHLSGMRWLAVCWYAYHVIDVCLKMPSWSMALPG